MTREEAIKIIKNEEECVLTDCFRPSCESCNLVMETDAILTALDMAIKALEQTEPCEAGTKMSLPECEDVPDINVGKIDGDELDEAIRFEERAAEAYSEAHNQFHDNVDPADAECCLNRAARHRQLASWLRELKRMRAQGTCEYAVSRVDVLECFSDLYDTFEDCSKGIVNELHRKFEDLRTLPSVTPKQDDWIMCSERLPEEHIGFYLVTIQKRRITALNVVGCDNMVYDIDIARWDYDRRAPQRGYHWCKADKIIAWMPLPEPYAERRTDD